MRKTTLKIAMAFIRPVLGTSSGNPEIQADFIVSKHPKIAEALKRLGFEQADKLSEEDQAKRLEMIRKMAVEELSAVTPMTDAEIQEQIEKSSSIFPKDEIGVFLWDYQVRGFIKESVRVLMELGDIEGLTPWSYKKAVDSFVFVNPRKIYLKDAAGQIIKEAVETLQRPIRVTTMQGDRVALARSEMLPEGTTADFEVVLLEGTNAKSKLAVLTEAHLRDAFKYGELKGMLQWRSGGFGSFTSEVTNPNPEPELTKTEPKSKAKAKTKSEAKE